MSFTQEEEEAEEQKSFLETASKTDILSRTEAIKNETEVYKRQISWYVHDVPTKEYEIKQNILKINVNRNLPYLVSTVVEVLKTPQPQENPKKAPKIEYTAVIKTSTRNTVFLPEIGFVEPDEIQPGDIIGVNKDTYLILEKLPPEHDSRVKAMELDEKPNEDFSQIGGLNKQIEELIEAVVLPMEHPDLFVKVGIRPPKGVLLYGPPGTGKTLLARAVAARTKASFMKLAGPQLVQMYVGDGAKLVRDAFQLAREKEPAIIFIDELDAIGAKRFDSERGADREVQRTMLELLNQLDGFTQNDKIKVIGATNRVDILDPALLRSGRIDRKIELPQPNLIARVQILKIHSRRMTVHADVNFEEIGRMTDDFNGAQLKAVCVEAGMIALRRGASEILHEDYVSGVAEVQAKKKSALQYYV